MAAGIRKELLRQGYRRRTAGWQCVLLPLAVRWKDRLLDHSVGGQQRLS